jgi:putative PIN family toxin of toxin-antitoxin system
MGQKKVTYCVIDTNVVISAILFGGVPGKLIDLWKAGPIVPLITEEIMTEYIRVLAYPKFKLSEEEINYIIHQEILPFFKVIKSFPGPSIIKQDPDDDKFIQCAQAGNAKTIISGDHHLLPLNSYKNLQILTPNHFLQNYG